MEYFGQGVGLAASAYVLCPPTALVRISGSRGRSRVRQKRVEDREQGAGPLLDSIIRLRSTSQVPTVYILLALRTMTCTDYVRSEAETDLVTNGLRTDYEWNGNGYRYGD